MKKKTKEKNLIKEKDCSTEILNQEQESKEDCLSQAMDNECCLSNDGSSTKNANKEESCLQEEETFEKKSFISAKEIAVMAMFVALIIVGTFIKIPIPYMPVTLQVFFVILCAMTLKGLRGFYCVLTYIFMGLIGIPVFSDGGGFQYVLIPSFGFILAFAIGALICGLLLLKWKNAGFGLHIAVGIIAIIAIYIVGCIYFYFMMNLYLNIEYSLYSLCVLFVPLFFKDCVMVILACVVSKKLKVLKIFH